MTTPARRALVIDDEVQLRRLLRQALQSRGYEVHEAENGTLGLQAAALRRPDVVLLDLGLPDMDGTEVLERLRGWSPVPVLVLSVRDQESIKVHALEHGADDYVTKPFSTAELLARLEVIQRRIQPAAEPVLTAGENRQLAVDLAAREVTLHGAPLKLTPTEYSLLALFVRHAGRVLTRRQVLTGVWGPQAADQAQYLRVYVTHLRRRLAGSGLEIRNEPGIGYRLVDAAPGSGS